MDIEKLFDQFAAHITRPPVTDKEIGTSFQKTMASLLNFDHVVVFAYREKERPLELFSTFNRTEHKIFVSLYQAGPYQLDPFYHASLARRRGLFRMQHLAPDRFFSSEYYRSYYIKTGLAEEVAFLVPADGHVSVAISLMRKQESGNFSSDEFERLRHSYHYVSTLVEKSWTGLGKRFDASKPSQKKLSRLKSDEHETVWTKLKLTSREVAIVELVLQGHSSESIGLKLGISPGTVKVHRRNVYRKLGIASQTQLFSMYLDIVS